MDLKKMVEDAIEKEMAENLQKHVNEQAAKMVKNLIDDQFRSFGTIRKQVETALEEGLKFDLCKNGIETINNYMSQVIASEMHKMIQSECGKNLQEVLFANLKISELKEIKLSEIVEKFVAEITQYSDKEGQSFTVHVKESSYGYYHIFFDENEDTSPYSCDFQLDIDKDGIPYSFNCDKGLKRLHGFERLLFSINTNKIKVILDDEYETEIYSEDY